MAKVNLNDLIKKKRASIRGKVDRLTKKPTITVMQVGNDVISSVYVEKKIEALKSFDIRVEHMKYHSTITESSLMNEILNCNADGILLQLPLPYHLKDKEQKIIDCIPASKDVDQLTTYSKGKLMSGDISILPRTVQGVIDIMKDRFKDIGGFEGKNIAILGRSRLVGMPLSIALIYLNADLALFHSKNKWSSSSLDSCHKGYDVVVETSGFNDFIKEGDVLNTDLVIDTVINRKDNGKLCGDYMPIYTNSDYDYTPVLGGLGILTILIIAENLIKLIKKHS